MGALVAAVNKKGENVVSVVVTMLGELAHRGKGGCGIATSDSVVTAATLEELKQRNLSSSVALGHNFSFILPRDKPQPLEGNGFTVVFEGRLFPSPKLPGSSEVQEIVGKLGSNPIKNAYKILKKMDGSYVFSVAESDRIIVGRDIFGTNPLYYGENETICAVASERKALWKIGLHNIHSFPPGQMALADTRGFSFHTVAKLRIPPKKIMDMETAARALEILLFESTRKQVSDLSKVAVSFSGGIDSSVVATLADNIGLEVQLISVGLKGEQEVTFTEQAAEALDLPIHIQTYNLRELEETFTKVLWLVEEPNPVNACIAVPFFWIAETASKLGYPVLLAGQGADELFGGYKRYLIEYESSGVEAVEQKMFYDVKNAYNANFQRDNQVCSYHGVELRLPFINRDVIDFGLRLPLRLKINSVEDKLRKQVLRRVAHNMEIPSFMANKRKKAIQYTTGVTKTLKRIAKNKNLTLREYAKQTYTRVCHPKNGN